MKVINREKAKELLNITDSSQDAAIDAKIPIIDAKVKQMTNNRYNTMIYGSTTSGSPYVPITSILLYNNRMCYYDKYRAQYYYNSGIMNPYYLDDIGEYVDTGQLVEGDGVPDDSYIDEIYYNGGIWDVSGTEYTVPTIKLSANATATDSVRLLLGINIGLQDIIAKGIQYLINGTSTTLPSALLRSETIGTYSYTNADTNINKTYGMPQWFVDSFPRYMSGH